MSKTAIGDWLLAIGSDDRPSVPGCVYKAPHRDGRVTFLKTQNALQTPNSPIANCQLPIASPPHANSCIVTPPVTSVMSHPLAGSVLITVGKVSPARLSQGGIGKVLKLDSPPCAVTGGTCIK